MVTGALGYRVSPGESWMTIGSGKEQLENRDTDTISATQSFPCHLRNPSLRDDLTLGKFWRDHDVKKSATEGPTSGA